MRGNLASQLLDNSKLQVNTGTEQLSLFILNAEVDVEVPLNERRIDRSDSTDV